MKHKHIKLFEQFVGMDSSKPPMTLNPLDISQEGDSVVAISLGEDLSFVLTSSMKAKQMVSDLRRILSGSRYSEELEGLRMSNKPGIAYVLVDPDQEPVFSFKESSFENQTSSIDFWITPEASEENPNDTGGYSTSVAVLKRDMVITASAGAEIYTRVQTIDEYLREFEQDLR